MQVLPRILLILSLVSLIFSEEENSPPEQVLHYIRPSAEGAAHFTESFHDESEFSSRWKKSEAKKDGVDEAISKYDGLWAIKEPKENPMLGDNSLVLISEAKHAAVSAILDKPFKFENKPLFVQYEVRFQNTHECGGAYLKLLSESSSLDLNIFGDKTPYTIMFGPDKCGSESKIHFIFQHEDPITHKMEEKHAKKSDGDFSKIFDDKKTHLMTLVVRPDNSFEISVDRVKVNEGSLLVDMEPPVNPPKEIDDPEDTKPDDWDEREKIIDSTATKPEDWDEDAPKQIIDTSAVKPSGWLDDEPELIADPAAVRPDDWDDVEDGEWEAPQIPNPKCKDVGCGKWQAPLKNNPDYKGKWTAPLVTNPDYKGVWAAKKIPNPNYFEDLNPFAMKTIAAVGFELWSMQSDIAFDNLIVSDDESLVNQWTLQTWQLKHEKEVADTPNALVSLWSSWKETTNEKPWLWIVAVVAILLPIVLIYIFCFPSKDSVAERKKTDAVVSDEEATESIDSADEDKEDRVAPEKENTESTIKHTKAESEEAVKNEEEEKEVDTVEDEIQSPSPGTRARRKTRKE